MIPFIDGKILEKGTENLSSSGNFDLLKYASAHITSVKDEMQRRTGTSLIPKSVKFNPNPISGTTAMLRPKLNARRSMPSRSLFRGKSIAIRE